jgi:hypothetical protein
VKIKRITRNTVKPEIFPKRNWRVYQVSGGYVSGLEVM